MPYREGILVSSNDWINTAAAGAEIEDEMIALRLYRPSDTARNLSHIDRFTFSLTDDPLLFFKASLTGHDTGEPELKDAELVREGPYAYPERATKVYFCRVRSRKESTLHDRYGSVDILNVNAKIESVLGEGPFIDRSDPRVDAMVYATRYPIATGSQREQIKEKIEGLLQEDDSTVGRMIMGWLGDEP